MGSPNSAEEEILPGVKITVVQGIVDKIIQVWYPSQSTQETQQVL